MKRCTAMTKRGKPCKNRARPGSDYCYVHSYLELETAKPFPIRTRLAGSLMKRSSTIGHITKPLISLIVQAAFIFMIVTLAEWWILGGENPPPYGDTVLRERLLQSLDDKTVIETVRRDDIHGLGNDSFVYLIYMPNSEGLYSRRGLVVYDRATKSFLDILLRRAPGYLEAFRLVFDVNYPGKAPIEELLIPSDILLTDLDNDNVKEILTYWITYWADRKTTYLTVVTWDGKYKLSATYPNVLAEDDRNPDLIAETYDIKILPTGDIYQLVGLTQCSVSVFGDFDLDPEQELLLSIPFWNFDLDGGFLAPHRHEIALYDYGRQGFVRHPEWNQGSTLITEDHPANSEDYRVDLLDALRLGWERTTIGGIRFYKFPETGRLRYNIQRP